MSYDGIVTHSIAEELNSLLCGGRINKVNQPDRNEIHLTIYNNRKNYKLLLGASSNLPRVYITEENKKNPLTAPNFCMFLRKHIQNGVIENISQEGLDRILYFDIKAYDELGISVQKRLIIELMGKHSNLILVKADDTIIDSMKRISKDISRVRQIIPGLDYFNIRDEKWDILKQGHIHPSELYKEDYHGEKLFQFFYKHYTGLSPLIGREICYRGNIAPSTRLQFMDEEQWQDIDKSFFDIYESIVKKDFHPKIYIDPNNHDYLDFHVLDIEYLSADHEEFESSSEMLEEFYRKGSQDDRISQKANVLRKIVQRKLNRDQNKLVHLENELLESKDREIYKIYGDLLSANAHHVGKGEKEIIVENFYDPDLSRITIPLDIKKSPWENTQYYYKLYSKMKNRHKLLEIQIPKIKVEIEYIRQLLDSMDHITEVNEIEEIREEMTKVQLLKKRKKKERIQSSKPLHYLTSSGKDVYVGKNNRQNDYLTLKLANKEDYFFHAKDISGSHVILRDNDLTETDFKEAAFLAAIYSSGKKEKVLDVDFTKKKNVKKPKSAKPGMVYYEDYETLLVDLKEYSLRHFKKKD